MAMIRDTRGQVITLVFILLLTFLFVTFEIYTFLLEKESVKTRVSTMNSFLDTIEKNLEKQLYVIGYRIIFLAETEITQSGSYVSFDDFFSEAFFNGTVNGIENNTYLAGATYEDLIVFLNEKSSKVNVEITLTNSTVTIYQDDPWYVTFQLESAFVMRDNSNLANWSKTQVIIARVPVSGFEDPLYTINSNARVVRKIAQTPYEGMYATGTNVSNLIAHVNQGYYAANENAPSFLNRLQGNLSADPFGIESFVDVTELANQGLTTFEKTRIDYLYFSANNPTYYSVTGMPASFFIDDIHAHDTKYNVSTLLY